MLRLSDEFYGGLGRIAALGAIVVNGAKSWFTGVLPDAWLFMLGALFIFVTLFMPKGIAGLFAGWTTPAKEKKNADVLAEAAE